MKGARDFVVLFLLITGACFLLGCGGELPPPPPPPTTTLPSSSPIIVFPIGIAGHNFVDSGGRPIEIRPCTECCWGKEESGWPGAKTHIIQENAEAGCNAQIIRIGPHSNRRGAPDPEAAPGTGWLAAQADTCRVAASLGVICIISVCDCWGIRTANNFYGWPWSILDFGPTREVEHWVSVALRNFVDCTNCIYETGNECFEFEHPSKWKGASVAWELGMKNLIRTYGGDRALVGTNTHRGSIEEQMDWVSLHQDTFEAAPHENKPTIVTEYKTMTPARWEENFVAARDHNTSFTLGWFVSAAARHEALQRLKRLTGRI